MNEQERPQSVVVAVMLLVASVLLGLIKNLLLMLPGPLWIAATITGVLLGLVLAIWNRKNWARISMLLFFLLSLPSFLWLGSFVAREGLVSIAIVLAQTIFQIGAFIILFSSQARMWFRPCKGVVA